MLTSCNCNQLLTQIKIPNAATKTTNTLSVITQEPEAELVGREQRPISLSPEESAKIVLSPEIKYGSTYYDVKANNSS